jgi:hypothetical protein
MAKNEEKLSTSELIMVQHEKIVDPFFPLLDVKKPFHAAVSLSIKEWTERRENTVYASNALTSVVIILNPYLED